MEMISMRARLIMYGLINIQKGRPDGFGKMYHRNGALFVGEFVEGQANGQGVYLKPDGSFYKGRFFRNTAHDQYGYYWSPGFTYNGAVKNNKFDGEAS